MYSIGTIAIGLTTLLTLAICIYQIRRADNESDRLYYRILIWILVIIAITLLPKVDIYLALSQQIN